MARKKKDKSGAQKKKQIYTGPKKSDRTLKYDATFDQIPYVHNHAENFERTVENYRIIQGIMNGKDVVVQETIAEINGMLPRVTKLENDFLALYAPKGTTREQFVKSYKEYLSSVPLFEAIDRIKTIGSAKVSPSKIEKDLRKAMSESRTLLGKLAFIKGSNAEDYNKRVNDFIRKATSYLEGTETTFGKEGKQTSRVANYHDITVAMGSVFEMAIYHGFFNHFKDSQVREMASELIDIDIGGPRTNITSIDFEEAVELMGKYGKPTPSDISFRIADPFATMKEQLDGYATAGINIKSMTEHSIKIGAGAPGKELGDFANKAGLDTVNMIYYYLLNVEALGTRRKEDEQFKSTLHTRTARQVYSSLALMNLKTVLFGKDIGFNRKNVTYIETILHVLQNQVHFTSDVLIALRTYLSDIGRTGLIKTLIKFAKVGNVDAGKMDNLWRAKQFAISQTMMEGSLKDEHIPITYDRIKSSPFVSMILKDMSGNIVNDFDFQVSLSFSALAKDAARINAKKK